MVLFKIRSNISILWELNQSFLNVNDFSSYRSFFGPLGNGENVYVCPLSLFSSFIITYISFFVVYSAQNVLGIITLWTGIMYQFWENLSHCLLNIVPTSSLSSLLQDFSQIDASIVFSWGQSHYYFCLRITPNVEKWPRTSVISIKVKCQLSKLAFTQLTCQQNVYWVSF